MLVTAMLPACLEKGPQHLVTLCETESNHFMQFHTHVLLPKLAYFKFVTPFKKQGLKLLNMQSREVTSRLLLVFSTASSHGWAKPALNCKLPGQESETNRPFPEWIHSQWDLQRHLCLKGTGESEKTQAAAELTHEQEKQTTWTPPWAENLLRKSWFRFIKLY